MSGAPGTLFVVATPIGNLEDITLRALRVLKSVAVVAAEDTRRTGNLLRHYEIPTPILSVHEHNELKRAPQLIARMRAGDSVALVTDAGTPGISDPGARLVVAAREAGIRVEPIPGASAVITALSAAGIETQGFFFLGFAPIRSKNRKQWLTKAAEESRERAVVLFEAPHRLHKTLSELAELVKRPIIAFRELTKVHEETAFGSSSDLISHFKTPQGEFTLVIPPGQEDGDVPVDVSDDQILDVFGQITENNRASSKREASRLVAERLGLTTKQVYAVLERHKAGS